MTLVYKLHVYSPEIDLERKKSQDLGGNRTYNLHNSSVTDLPVELRTKTFSFNLNTVRTYLVNVSTTWTLYQSYFE